MDPKSSDGVTLALQCYVVNELAEKASKMLKGDLDKIVKEKNLYRLDERLKGQESIQNKVLRKRDEIKRSGLPGRYEPENVTDAWGTRIVTYFKSQILDTLSSVFALIHKKELDGVSILIDEIVIYDNRPLKDPLSIAVKAKQLVDMHAITYSSKKRPNINVVVDTKDTGYSSVHIVLNVPIQDFLSKVGASFDINSVKIEIQIRDVFEDAWGQISHLVTYQTKDKLYTTGAHPNRTVEEIVRPHLNALKTISDGCSQYAEQIRETHEELLGRLKGADYPALYVTVTSLEQDEKMVIDAIKTTVSDEVIQRIHVAYALLKDANDAFYKNTDRRVARNNFLAAAEQFGLAQKAAQDATKVTITGTGRRVLWYLQIERANALILSLPPVPEVLDPEGSARFREAIALYNDLETHHPADPVIQFRKAQAQQREAAAEADFRAIIKQLDSALGLLEKEGARESVSINLLSLLARIEKALVKLKLVDKVQDGQEKTGILRDAVEDFVSVVEKCEPDLTDATRRPYWRGLSNTLWCYHKLHELKLQLSENDRIRIKSFIAKLTALPSVRDSSATIENLMFGCDIVDMKKDAVKWAKFNIELLEQTAGQRGWQEDRPVSHCLEGDEKEIYDRAVFFIKNRPTGAFSWSKWWS